MLPSLLLRSKTSTTTTTNRPRPLPLTNYKRSFASARDGGEPRGGGGPNLLPNENKDKDQEEDSTEAPSPFDSRYSEDSFLIDPKPFLSTRKTIKVGRHIKVTAGGRIPSHSSLVFIGNGNGAAGLGYGKALKVQAAAIAAERDAEKNMFAIYRWQDRTISRPVYVKFGVLRLLLKPNRPMMGTTTNKDMIHVAQGLGLEDITIRTWGPRKRNKHTMYHAIMQGIKLCTDSPKDLARLSGRKYYNYASFHPDANQAKMKVHEFTKMPYYTSHVIPEEKPFRPPFKSVIPRKERQG